MKIGTKSVLFGVHCWCIHPFMVWIAWIKLYGWTWSLPTIVSFFVHDLGYIGKPNMDGKEGETHVELGAKIMFLLFDWGFNVVPIPNKGRYYSTKVYNSKWYAFTLYHSRFYSKNNDVQYSRLCVADKYAFCIYPKWLYILLASLSGEIYEYMESVSIKYTDSGILGTTKNEWYETCYRFLYMWVANHCTSSTPKELRITRDYIKY